MPLSPLMRGNRYRGQLQVAFFTSVRAQPPMCRGQHDRHGGQVTTVGKRERVTGAAKIEPLRERLSGMCGSVQH
jgi:hypothetical protein